MDEYEYKKGTFTKASTYREAANQYSGLEWAAQLSEEASELSKAALKLRRVCNPESIPVSSLTDDAIADLIEEINDVIMCFSEVSRHVALTDEQIIHAGEQIMIEKREQFLKRHNEYVDRYNAYLHYQELYKTQHVAESEEKQT